MPHTSLTSSNMESKNQQHEIQMVRAPKRRRVSGEALALKVMSGRDTETTEKAPTNTKQYELSRIVAELGSPAEIAAFFMGMNYHLETENRKLQSTGSSVTIKSEQQRLAKQIAGFSSSPEIAAFFLGTNFDLAGENQKLKVAAVSHEAQIGKLSEKTAELSEQIALYNTTGSSFTCFSKLPAEIRIQIWRYAIPQARLVELKVNNLQFDCPKNRQPGILHACKEAREEVLKQHPLCLEKSGGVPRYFNHDLDVLSVDSNYMDILCGDIDEDIDYDWEFADLDISENLKYPAGFNPLLLRHIAIDSDSWDNLSRILIDRLNQFPKLEEIIIIANGWSVPRSTGTKLFDLDDREDINWYDFDQGGHAHMDVDQYRPKIADTFGEEIDMEIFEEQWVMYYRHNDDLWPGEVQNPWLKNDRTPPRIRIMRTIANTATTLEN